MSPSSTPDSDKHRVARFCLRVVLFSVPLLFIAALFEITFYRTGDSWPLSKVLQAQSELAQSEQSDSIHGRAYFSQEFNRYKLAMIKHRQPKILVLGSSRVLELRNFMFHPYEEQFYNAGSMIQTVNDLVEYTKQVREGTLSTPQVIIIGIDPWWVGQWGPRPGEKSWLVGDDDAVYSFSSHVEAARLMVSTGKSNFPWRVAFTGAPRIAAYYPYPAIGIGALIAGTGTRYSDGSLLYGKHIADYVKDPQYHDRLIPPILDRIKTNTGFFPVSNEVDRVRADLLIKSLASLKSLGIEVYAYQPPFPTEIFQTLNNSKVLATWWSEYKGWLRERLAEIGINCLLVDSPQGYGLDDRYMIDGVHPSEVFDTYIVEKLIKQAPPGSLLSSVDLKHLTDLRTKDKVLPICFDPPP